MSSSIEYGSKRGGNDLRPSEIRIMHPQQGGKGVRPSEHAKTADSDCIATKISSVMTLQALLAH
jgi:hypothetical protein